MSERASPQLSLAWALPPLLCLAVFFAWAVAGGGYSPTDWYPGGLVIAGLVIGLGVARIRGLEPSPLVATALAFLAAFGALSILSIAWADVQGDAWDGGNRALVYAAVATVFALTPWSPPNGALVLGAAAVGLAGIGFLVVASAAASDDPESFFVSSRFAEPTGYPNAAAALYLVPLFAALVLASRRELPGWARGLLLGTSGALLAVGLLPQSRASIAAMTVTLAIVVAVARERLRTLLAAALVALVTAPFAGALLSVDLYETRESADVTELLADARNAVLIVFAVLALAGFVWAWLEANRPVPESVVQRLDRALVVAAGALAMVVLLGLVVAGATGRIGDAWSDFRSPEELEETDESSHLGAPLARGNRYDIWRVALGQFKDSPLVGAGADNFEADYVRERRAIDEPQHPHGLPFRALGQTGIVGTALLLGFICAAGFAALRSARRLDAPESAGVALAGLAAFTYWLVHGTVDWLWEFPAVSGVALGSLALAASVERAPGGRVAARAQRVIPVALVVAAVAVAASLLPPWLAQREMTEAGDVWRTDPAAALEALESAHDLNPLSDSPDVLAGAIAGRSGDFDRARAAFADALERNPTSWYSYLELAVLAYEEDDTATALAELRRGRALNPRDQVMREVERLMRADERVNLKELDGLWSRQLARLSGDERE